MGFNIPGGPNIPGIIKEEIVGSQEKKIITAKEGIENEIIGNSGDEGDEFTSNSENKYDNVVGELNTPFSIGITGVSGISGCIGNTGPIGPKGFTCTFSTTIPNGGFGYCCMCPTIPSCTPEGQLKNLSQVNDFFNYFNNITTNAASLKVYQEELVYFTRKVRPLLDTVNSLSFALQNAAVATQVIQSIPFSHKSQIKETLELNQELVKETMCVVQVLKKRLSIFRSMAMMDIEKVGCMEKTGCMNSSCNFDDCENICKKCKKVKCKCCCKNDCDRE